MSAAALTAIAYEVGELRSAHTLLDAGVAVERLSELLEKGVQSYSVLDRPLGNAIVACVTETLTRASVRPERVDSVILVTESFESLFENVASEEDGADAFRCVRNQAFELFAGMGIAKASVLCATYGGCTNVLHAILLAQAMVEKGLARNVLLVAAEKYGNVEARFMPEAVSIAGDGVASCLVSAVEDVDGGGVGAYQVDYVSTAPYKKFQIQADLPNLLLEMFRAMKSAAADTYEGCGRQPEEFRWLVLGDYNRLTSATYSRLLGFKPESTFLDNVGRMGHIPFDSLINLADLRTGGQVASGDSLLLFLCGPISCGSVALKAI